MTSDGEVVVKKISLAGRFYTCLNSWSDAECVSEKRGFKTEESAGCVESFLTLPPGILSTTDLFSTHVLRENVISDLSKMSDVCLFGLIHT